MKSKNLNQILRNSLSEVDGLLAFILTDDGQLLLLIRKKNGKRVAALWTNYDVFIKALKALFLELWNNDA